MSRLLPSLPVLPRLGYASRLIMFILLLLLAAIAVLGGVTFLARNSDPSTRFPLADQIAAIHAVLDNARPADRALLLRAVSSPELAVEIVASRPLPVSEAHRLRGVEWVVSHYLETVGRHEVYAAFTGYPSRLAQLLARLSPTGDGEISIAISLSSGEYMLVSLRGSPAARFFGMPVGFWIGALGALVAAVVVLTILREARPIEQLAGSLAAFANDAVPRPVAAGGAPEIRTLVTTTNDMQARIAALLKGRSILLGAISHDLRTFLTRLRLRVEAIEAEDERARAVRDIEDMTDMIDTALAVARGGAVGPRREAVDMAALIRAELDSRPAGTTAITFEEGRGHPTVMGDAVALRRLVTNLVDNASRHGRTVGLHLDDRGGRVALAVDDDGPGIPEAERTAVFEPFYRLDASRNRGTGGSGLGLTIARSIVAAHGGSIAIETSPLGGARVLVLLPAVREQSGPAKG